MCEAAREVLHTQQNGQNSRIGLAARQDLPHVYDDEDSLNVQTSSKTLNMMAILSAGRAALGNSLCRSRHNSERKHRVNGRQNAVFMVMRIYIVISVHVSLTLSNKD